MADWPLELATLRLLASVAETGSLGQAARRLGISQPAASLRLQTMERRTGLRLLDRTSSGSRLTAAGASVVDWSRPVLDAADALERSVAALRASAADRLRVAASLTIADHLVPEWLVAYHAAVPHASVALDVVNSEAVAALVRSGAADLGFVEGATVPRGLRVRQVGGDELVVIVAPGHPWTRRRRPLPVEALVGSPLILRERGSGTREALERALAAHGCQPQAALELGSTTAIKAAVMAGEGPAVLSRLAVTDDERAGRLVVVPTEGLRLARRFRAVWRGAARLSGPAAALLGIALAAARHPANPPPLAQGGRIPPGN